MALSDPDAGETLAHLRRLAALAKVPAEAVGLPRHHHVVLGERRFHYVEWGREGTPPILFLHGGNQSARTWDVVCMALAPRFHCIALDQRGHGLSEWSYEFDYSPEASAGDVAHLVDHLRWPRFALVGMSMGCLNGMSYAASNAARLAGFVAVDAGPYIESAGGAEIIDFVQANRTHGSLDDFVAAAVKFNPRRNPDFLRHSLRHTVRQNADGTFAWRSDRRQPLKLDAMLAWLEHSRTLLPRITCPTLVIRGAESNILTEEGATRFARELPNGRTVTVPNAGHTVQGDNPAGLLAVLDDFLATLSL
jgi:esterase